jgi:arsenate reductase-like glutaredoxin family protein
MNAREFLAQTKQPFEERDLLKAPLNEAELQSLAKRMGGGVRAMIKPRDQEELARLKDSEVIPFLAKNPNYVRRPIIDTGKLVVGGFNAESKAKLGVK